MGRPPLNIDIAKKDQQTLRARLQGGVQQVRVVLRALALLQLAENASAPQIARVIPLTPQAIRRLGHRYEQAGLNGALYEKQRPGAAEVLDPNQKQRIIAMVCSDPPQGRARWTVRLVAEEAVKRKLVPAIGRETIRILLYLSYRRILQKSGALPKPIHLPPLRPYSSAFSVTVSRLSHAQQAALLRPGFRVAAARFVLAPFPL